MARAATFLKDSKYSTRHSQARTQQNIKKENLVTQAFKKLSNYTLRILIAGVVVYFTLSFFLAYDFLSDLKETKLVYLFVSVGMLVVGYYVNAWRWYYVIAVYSKARLSVRSLFYIISIVATVSNSFPGRVGELVKAYVLYRRGTLRWEEIFSCILTERVLDLFVVMLAVLLPLWMLSGYYAVDLDLQFSANLRALLQALHFAGNTVYESMELLEDFDVYGMLVQTVIFVGVGLGALGLGVIAFSQYAATMSRFVRKLLFFLDQGNRFFAFVDQLLGHVLLMRKSPKSFAILLLSVMTWGAYGLSVYYAFLAFSLDIYWYWAFPVLGMSALGLLAALTPGSLGTYELTFIAAALLVMPQSVFPEITRLVSCAFVIHASHIIITLLIALLGFFHENMQISDFRKTQTLDS